MQERAAPDRIDGAAAVETSVVVSGGDPPAVIPPVAKDGGPRPWDGGGSVDIAPVPAPVIVRLRAADEKLVTTPRRVGLVIGMSVFGVTVILPVVLMLWAALALAATGLAGATLVHTDGLEPDTFGTALAIGLGVAALLLVVVMMAGRRADGLEDAYPEMFYARSLWSRHPALVTAIAALVLSILAGLAGATHSPFFPYPWATIVLVATVVFVAVTALIAAARAIRGALRALYRWACVGSYRVGLATAACLLVGLAGGWAAYAGWTERPARLVADQLALDRVEPPRGLVEAGAMALCLGAGEVEPALARSAAAPLCAFLPADRD